MKARILATAFSVWALPALHAQTLGTSICPQSTQVELTAQNVCQQTFDSYRYIVPQVALALTGGNLTLGQNSTLGGFGTFSIGLRATGFSGAVPNVGAFPQTTGAAQRATLPTSSQAIAIPAFDVSIGVFGGVPLGLTNVGGVDLIMSSAIIPDINAGSLILPPHTNYQLGYGLRIGLLSESLLVPGVSVTVSQRDLPTVTMGGSAGNSDLSIINLGVNTRSWRLVGSKNLLFGSIAVGTGVDNVDLAADLVGQVRNGSGAIVGSATPTASNSSYSRSTYFANVGLNLLLFRVVGEVGRVAAVDALPTFNSFSDGPAGRALTYGSLGIRFGR